MPTYDYLCESCGHRFEQMQVITAKPLRKCPACGKSKLKRLIGAGSGVIFKGSGFYATDYRSEGYKKKSESEKCNIPGGKPPAAKETTKKEPETKEKPAKKDKPAGGEKK